MGIAMTYIYLPVFHDLQITSTYHVSQNKEEKFFSWENDTRK